MIFQNSLWESDLTKSLHMKNPQTSEILLLRLYFGEIKVPSWEAQRCGFSRKDVGELVSPKDENLPTGMD